MLMLQKPLHSLYVALHGEVVGNDGNEAWLSLICDMRSWYMSWGLDMMWLWVFWHVMMMVMDMALVDVTREPWAHVIDLIVCPWLLASLYIGSWVLMCASSVGPKNHICAFMHLCLYLGIVLYETCYGVWYGIWHSMDCVSFI